MLEIVETILRCVTFDGEGPLEVELKLDYYLRERGERGLRIRITSNRKPGEDHIITEKALIDALIAAGHVPGCEEPRNAHIAYYERTGL